MKLSINNPCHENWDGMTPNNKGAFCLSCKKNVIDFSNKTVTEIKEFFNKKTGNESVCGRFDEQQLNAITFDDFFNSFMNWKYFQKAALIVFFVFGLSLFAGAQSKPKNEPKYPVMGAVAYVPQDTVKKISKKDSLIKPAVKGKVNYNPEKPLNKKSQSQKKQVEDSKRKK